MLLDSWGSPSLLAGKGALKEGYAKLVSRLLSFSKFFIAHDEERARKVCSLPLALKGLACRACVQVACKLRANCVQVVQIACVRECVHIAHACKQEIPGYTALFDSKSYQAAVAEICPGKPVLDPFQLGVIVQVPGQQVRQPRWLLASSTSLTAPTA